MSLPATERIKGMEVLRPGTFNGVPISRRDLEDMVVAFDETHDALPVTIRLGHDARQAMAKALFGAKAGAAAATDEHGWPSLGNPTRLYMDDDVLRADVDGVPATLAQWVRDRRYETRSGGLRYNRQVGSKVYRWMLDHIALLGADTPAVDGLAAIGLSESDADRAIDAVIRADDGALSFADERSPLERFLEDMDLAISRYEDWIAKRKGAPMVRQLFAAAMAKLRESARVELPLHSEETAVKDPITPDVELADVPAPDAAAPQPGGIAISTPEVLAAMLAAKAGVGPEDYASIYKACIAALEAAGATDPGAAPEGEAPMSDNVTIVPETTTVTPQVVELSAIVTRQGNEIATLRKEAALGRAQARVAADEAAKGFGFEAPLREVLVNLAAEGREADYVAIVGSQKTGVPTNELGTAAGGEAAQVELSARDAETAARFGVTPERFLAQKAADAGVTG